MTKARGRQRKGLVDMSSLAPESPHDWRPPLDECQRDDNVIDLLGPCRVVQSMYFHRGQVVHFALMQQYREDEDADWREVVRVDTCHEEVHIHRFNPDGDELYRRLIRKVTCPADIIVGLDHAEELIFGAWEENLRRWERGR